MSGEQPQGPLHGLLVVDFSRVLAGPFTTMLLADLGARVIKIERPRRGDDSRSYGPFVDGRSLYFARVNRGKESVALNLRDERDRRLVDELVRQADVLVENFRPGVMQRLGLGYDEVRQHNERIVYASISGFGQTGPWRLRPAYDAVVQATSGVMSITGMPDGEPIKPGIPVADLSAGLYTFGAILAALWGRERTGVGCRVDVAMQDSTVSLLEGAALSFLATGQTPPRIGNAHYAIAPFDTFHTADRPVVICAANDELFAALARALARPELVDDPLFRTNRDRHDNRLALKVELERTLATRPSAEWLAAFDAVGVPCAPVADVAEALGSPQCRHRRMVVEAGGLPIPGNPIKLSAFADPEVRPAAPELDQHGEIIRREFGGVD